MKSLLFGFIPHPHDQKDVIHTEQGDEYRFCSWCGRLTAGPFRRIR